MATVKLFPKSSTRKLSQCAASLVLRVSDIGVDRIGFFFLSSANSRTCRNDDLPSAGEFDDSSSNLPRNTYGIYIVFNHRSIDRSSNITEQTSGFVSGLIESFCCRCGTEWNTSFDVDFISVEKLIRAVE